MIKKVSPSPQMIQNMPDLVLLKDIDQTKILAKLKSKEELKIVYFGTPEFSAFILEELIKYCNGSIDEEKSQLDVRSSIELLSPIQFSIQTVISRPDQPTGRKQTVQESPVSQVARRYGIPTLKPTKLDTEFLSSHFSLLTSHLFIVASYGKIIPQALLDIPELGAINVHPSLLPKYRGASPIINPILNGDKKTGVSIMLMDSQMDHGPLLATKKISISANDNNQTLSTKLSQVSAELLIDTLVRFVQGQVKPVPQNHDLATFTKIVKKEDGYFDINNPPSPEVLDRMVRAYYPWPGVWTIWRVKSQESRVKDRIVKFLPGDLIQMEGKKPQTIQGFLNSYPDFPLFNA